MVNVIQLIEIFNTLYTLDCEIKVVLRYAGRYSTSSNTREETSINNRYAFAMLEQFKLLNKTP
jgi:hypothetical protein